MNNNDCAKYEVDLVELGSSLSLYASTFASVAGILQSDFSEKIKNESLRLADKQALNLRASLTTCDIFGLNVKRPDELQTGEALQKYIQSNDYDHFKMSIFEGVKKRYGENGVNLFKIGYLLSQANASRKLQPDKPVDNTKEFVSTAKDLNLDQDTINKILADIASGIEILKASLANREKSTLRSSPKTATTSKLEPKRVFVVHGRNGDARDALFTFLRSISLQPIEWSEAIQLTGKPNPFIGEILDTAFSAAQAIVVLLSPDDVAYLHQELVSDTDPIYEKNPTPQARPNVLFEAGMAMGRCPARTILVELGYMRPFSDIGGRHVVRIDNTSERRQDLAQRLITAGCDVNLGGRDWHNAGDFQKALKKTIISSVTTHAPSD